MPWIILENFLMFNKTTALLKASIEQIIRVSASTKRQKKWVFSVLALGLARITRISPQYLRNSERDDGKLDTKDRKLNLTDF